MAIFPQHVLDSLASKYFTGPDGKPRGDGAADPPRAMMAWALEGRFEEQPHRWAPDMDGITENHRMQACAARLWAHHCPGEWEHWMLARLESWRQVGECMGEQTSSTYDKHHAAALAMTAAAAARDGRASLGDAALDALRRWVSLRELLRAPESTHRSVAGRIVMPGRRCGDVAGMSSERDVLWHLLTRLVIPSRLRWPVEQDTQMECHLVAHLVASPHLPPIARQGPLPMLEDTMHVQRYTHGHAGWTPLSTMRTGRGGAILWAVVVDYRTGAVDSVSWRDPLGLPYNAAEAQQTGNDRRPLARQMGGGPMPAPLPRTDHLGPAVKSWRIEGSQTPGAEPPPPAAPPPADPPPSADPPPPTNPPPPTDGRGRIPGGHRLAPHGEHAVLPATENHPAMVVRILPSPVAASGMTAEFVRWA